MADPKKSPDMSAATRLLLALQHGGPMTAAELQKFCDRSESAVRMQLAKLRKPGNRLVRICGWEQPIPPSNQLAAVYEVGSARDMEKPKPKTQSEYSKRYRAKVSVVRAIRRKAAQGQVASPWDALLRLAA